MTTTGYACAQVEKERGAIRPGLAASIFLKHLHHPSDVPRAREVLAPPTPGEQVEGMNINGIFGSARFALAACALAAAFPALALSNRVFVSARSGNNANACDDIRTPCQSFAGAVVQLNPAGEVIVLESGGYGPVTITQSVTIEAPAGVTAFVHPPSGDAITVAAGSGTVTLRGLTLNTGGGAGIYVTSVGTLNVENCSISGFGTAGIGMSAAGRLNVKGTDVKGCYYGVQLAAFTGATKAQIDHSHLDGNVIGFCALTSAPATSTTTATFSTANGNTGYGWLFGGGGGTDVLTLEFCSGSENTNMGLVQTSSSAQSVMRFSNCVFSDNGIYGVQRSAPGTVESRGNNTITGNGTAPTSGAFGAYTPM